MRASSHPKTPVGTAQFPMRKRAIFVQGLGDQGFVRRRTPVRRTRKSEDRRRDCRKAPFSDGNGLDSGRFRYLSRTDASGANLQVFWSAVDHRPDALEIGQPAPLADIVGMGYLASAHWALAADFTSLRHRRYPPRNPHTGVELNSTGGLDLQVLGSLIRWKIVHHGEL